VAAENHTESNLFQRLFVVEKTGVRGRLAVEIREFSTFSTGFSTAGQKPEKPTKSPAAVYIKP